MASASFAFHLLIPEQPACDDINHVASAELSRVYVVAVGLGMMKVQLTGRVDDMQTSLSEVQQQTAVLMQSEGRWREEALRLQVW